MGMARQRKIEARNKRQQSINAWVSMVEQRKEEEKIERRKERARKIAEEKGISFEEAMSLIKKSKLSRKRQNINELSTSTQGNETD